MNRTRKMLKQRRALPPRKEMMIGCVERDGPTIAMCSAVTGVLYLRMMALIEQLFSRPSRMTLILSFEGGETIEEAEKDAWETFQSYRECDHPNFKRDGHEDGTGVCVSCGMTHSDVFDPDFECGVCGETTDHAKDWNEEGERVWFCGDHVSECANYHYRQILEREKVPEGDEYSKALTYLLEGPGAVEE